MAALTAAAGSAPASAAPAEAATTAAVVRYEVRGQGHTGDLEEFAAAAAETYADPRGWAGGGAVRFERVPAGGDFTLWLAADADMASFGGACDRVWSCRSGRNVVINEDRWRGASPAWNESGAGLWDYRHMVVNHETGHWLGQGHQRCAGNGRPAPVMQQQSMGLQGCAPNPWPMAVELARAQASGSRLPGSDCLGNRGRSCRDRREPPDVVPSAAVLVLDCAYSPWHRMAAACAR